MSSDIGKLYEVADEEEAQTLRALEVRAGLLLACPECGATYPEPTECEFCGVQVGRRPAT